MTATGQVPPPLSPLARISRAVAGRIEPMLPLGFTFVIVAVAVQFGGYAAVVVAPTMPASYWWRYGRELGVRYADVTVERRPRDCTFLAAPIGIKGCHYRADVVTVVRPAVPSVHVTWVRVDE